MIKLHGKWYTICNILALYGLCLFLIIHASIFINNYSSGEIEKNCETMCSEKGIESQAAINQCNYRCTNEKEISKHERYMELSIGIILFMCVSCLIFICCNQTPRNTQGIPLQERPIQERPIQDLPNHIEEIEELKPAQSDQ